MANEQHFGNFTVVNHLTFLFREKIAKEKIKETSGDGAGSQMNNLDELEAFARFSEEVSKKSILIDDKIIIEVQKLIKQNIDQLECDEYKTNNQKLFILCAVTYKVFERLNTSIKTGRYGVRIRWFVSKFANGYKFGSLHRTTLTKYLAIVQETVWSRNALEQMNKLQKDIIKLLF